jgi:DNA-binding CsgD family transcriptional regulator
VARLAASLDLPSETVQDAYWTVLPQHVGCTGYAHEAAAPPRRLRPRQLRGRRADRAAAGAGRRRRAQPDEIYEAWNGRGEPQGLEGESIALPARISHGALFGRLGGPELAVAAIRRRAGRSLDPPICAAFCGSARELLGELDGDDPLDLAVAAEPAPLRLLAEPALDGLCRALADVVDLKSPYHHGHSAGVAELAEDAARRLGLAGGELAGLRRAALLHDLGRAAVPNGIWEKPGPLGGAEWEQVRLHAYHGERVPARCRPLAELAPLAGMHHERLDGSGYHRGATAPALPAQVRVLAAADALQAMTQERPHRPALPLEAAAAELRAEARRRIDGEAADAVLAAGGQAREPRRRSWPGGLTDRHVEVLRLLARGCSNGEIAAQLVVSPRTAEHHVQDIYARIGVSSRAAAALFAMQHDLLR